jgi:serine protease Do
MQVGAPFVAWALAALTLAPLPVTAQVPAGASPVPVAGAEDPAAVSPALGRAIARVAPSLVRIHVVSIDFRDGREIKREASGSGTIISRDGYVVTNHHVAGKTRAILCTLADREEMPAVLVGTDPMADIAVLKLQPPSPRTFPAARWGDVSRLRVGERVLALGSPLALSQSVTMGIVSNTEMIMPGMFWPFNRMTLDGEDVGSIVRWIGHDAPIFGGNSGGPLVNLDGEIVGVNEISLGLAGAIPADLAREVAEAIIRDGHVTRAWIGVEVQPLLQESGRNTGALVGGTIAGSPGERAGLKSGDIIVALGAEPVTVRFAEQVPLFNQQVMRLPIGKPVPIEIVRDGVKQVVQVTPVERERVEAEITELAPLGITASGLTSWAALELNRRGLTGVRVRGVRPGGPADQAKPALRDDDVIVSVEGAPVSTIDALREALERVTAGHPEGAPSLVEFERDGQRLLTVVDVGQPEVTDLGVEARKAWVPVSVQVLTRELAEKLGLGEGGGVRVTRVLSADVPLQVGDVITAVDDEPVEASQPSDSELFATMIRQYKIGSTVKLSLSRGTERRQVSVTLAASPRLPREMKKYDDPNFEFRVREVAESDRRDGTVPSGARGVLVDAVREGGWAALAHLAVEDLLLAIDGHAVGDVETVHRLMTEAADRRARSVVLQVRRGIRTFFVEIQPVWKS